jgi:hypothetical protein
MGHVLEDGRSVRYSFTIDFAEPDVDSYPIDELAAEEVDGDENAIRDSLIHLHAEAIFRASDRIKELLQSDETLDSILTAHNIGLVMGLSH